MSIKKRVSEPAGARIPDTWLEELMPGGARKVADSVLMCAYPKVAWESGGGESVRVGIVSRHPGTRCAATARSNQSESIVIELTALTSKLKEPREGSKLRIYGT